MSEAPLRSGDAVRLTTDTGRQVVASVRLASKNGRSLALEFDAMIGGWLGGVAVFLHDDGVWRALDGMPVTITRLREEQG